MGGGGGGGGTVVRSAHELGSACFDSFLQEYCHFAAFGCLMHGVD